MGAVAAVQVVDVGSVGRDAASRRTQVPPSSINDLMPIVRPFLPHEWELYRELRLAALADTPDAFGSTLAREAAFGDQEWIARLATGATSARDLPLMAEDEGRAVGLAWARIGPDDPGTVALYQVWVHPDARRRGVGRLLLDAAMAWAKDAGAAVMELDVALGPASAFAFYRRAGFVEVGETRPLRPGSELLQQAMRRSLA